MDKKIITLKLCFLILFSCNSQAEKTKKDKDIVLYDIIFANGFDSDEIIFAINGNDIIKSVLLSDKSDGITSLTYQIIKRNDKIILVNHSKSEYAVKNQENIIITVTHKGKDYDFQLTQESGKYILIELYNDKIEYHQQKEEPLFD